jgi:16S rRNA (guanine966-N2)-methyltransferase
MRLIAPRGSATRPTTDRVRESLFAILGSRIQDGRIVDLFCGAGCLGLEALSRGAGHVTFVDSAAAALTALRKNCDTVGTDGGEVAVVRRDAVAWLRAELTRAGPELILLADPPYGSGAVEKLLDLLRADRGRLRLVAFEHPRNEEPATPPGWRRDTRGYGRTGITILERET